MPELEERVARIEGVIEQMNARIGDLVQRMNHIESRLTWMLGIMITMWVTIILAIFFK